MIILYFSLLLGCLTKMLLQDCFLPILLFTTLVLMKLCTMAGASGSILLKLCTPLLWSSFLHLVSKFQSQWTTCQTKWQIRLIRGTLLYFIFYWDIFKVKIFMQRQFSASQSRDFLRTCNIVTTLNVFLDLLDVEYLVVRWTIYLHLWIISIPSYIRKFPVE